MRALFIIPLVLMSLVSFPSWGLDIDDLVTRAGRHYQKSTATPFTGEVEGLDQGKFRDSKKEESWEYYYLNGQLRSKANFKNGRHEGFCESYYDNGQLMYKGDYVNGKREGFWKGYYDNGSVWNIQKRCEGE